MTRPRTPVWVLVTLFWLILAIVYSTQIALMTPRPSEPMLRTQIAWQSIYYLAWAPFTLLIWRMTRGWDLEHLGWWRFLGIHAAVGVGIGVAQAAFVVAVAALALPPLPANEPITLVLRGYIRSRLHMQLLIYAAIVGTGQAIGFYNRYRERQVAAARLEAQLAAARLDTLRAQLQPHFLFNSLHSIASLARAGDTAGVVRLIAGFSELLRHLLDSHQTHHSVRDELALVDRYLDIQRVRFGDRLRVTIDATADAVAARIPLLVVQPLVENALRHGLAPRVEPGQVSVRARRDGGDLVIEVTDNGIGLPDGWARGRGPGTGLNNLASRLAGEFGDAQSLLVMAGDTGGVRATVRVPYARA